MNTQIQKLIEYLEEELEVAEMELVIDPVENPQEAQQQIEGFKICLEKVREFAKTK